MVPDADRPSDPDGPQEGTEPGDAVPGIDESTLYRIVRDAVEDALLGAIGTLLLVGIAFLLLIAGVQFVVRSSTTLGLAFGAAMAIVATYVAAAALEIVPPLREWL